VESFNQSIIDKNNQNGKPEEGLIKRMLSKIGIIKSAVTPKNLWNTIQALRKVKTK